MKYIKYLLLLSIISYSILALTIGEENLFKAIDEKNSQNVSSILSGDTNININVLDANGYAPIHRAIYNNDLATVNELLKNTNLNINSKLDIRVAIDGWYLGGASPLILASYLGYTNIVETLLNNNANIKAKDDVDGSMAIHMAAANGNNDIIKILLSKDETIINEKDNKGNTPLHWASMKDKPETIKLLVENGADIESKDIDGWTPLHYASAFSSLETVENLINLGADTKSKANDGSVPLSYAQKDEVKNYLAGKENIERENEDSKKSEDNIIRNDPNEIEKEEDKLEEKKEETTSPTPTIEPLENKELDIKQLELLVAIKNNDIIAVNNLIKEGVNPNFQDEEGFSPLHRAIEIDSLDLVNALLSYKGIDTEIKLPYEVTSSNGWYLGGDTPLLYASYMGNSQIVSALLNANCNIRARDDIDGAMAIHIAAANEHNDIVNLLIKKDKTLLNEKDNNGGDTPLHWAIIKSSNSTIRLLLSLGANPSQQNSSGQNPLHYGALYGNMDAVVVLVEKYNVNKGLKDKDGDTAADIASQNGYENIASYLSGSAYVSRDEYKDKNADKTEEYKYQKQEEEEGLPVYNKKRDLTKKWWVF
ncbi:ankyrin repeat domain-containing protein [Brachyspira aalborgi]|uniref:ankyrin repeat domain-containing protein n=1 Tax=Brachyspira aalborgi TaxID=29522 RepID=UPI0011C80B63|nr:ankyrin repeat domain-containing protein [Brachyspira aalborgi]TXJ15484.1 ankyrin repeat domain-containing protein [Brachyspira aalborgi]TXJ17879.1 ankyrin repeat domain-containing protein [Brachyspira aalborgi]